jgi:hypothetical protein
MPDATPILVEISPGELIDKITILQIKAERITDPAKLASIRAELTSLLSARDRAVPSSSQLDELWHQLKTVNESLWQIEDDLRLCEAQQDFGPHFIQLARQVYLNNDQRFALKRQINNVLGSSLREEKAHPTYPRA